MKRWGPVLAWAAVIFALSSIPSQSLPEVAGAFGVDKLAHAAVFGVLGYLTARALDVNATARFAVAVLLVSLYGASDELHQLLTPGRDASVWDFVADTIGGSVGAAVHLVLSRARANAGHP